MNKQNRQRIDALYLEYSKKRWPSVPDHARTVFKGKDNSTNGLTNCVVEFINLSGYQAERISNEGRVIDNRKKVQDIFGQTKTLGSIKRIPSSMTKGTADISATIHGRSVKIEIKFGKDRQSEAQKKYQDKIEKAGGVYIIVRTFDGFIEWYDKFLASL